MKRRRFSPGRHHLDVSQMVGNPRHISGRESSSGSAMPSSRSNVVASPSRRGSDPNPVASHDVDFIRHRLSLGEARPFPPGPGSCDPGPPPYDLHRVHTSNEVTGG